MNPHKGSEGFVDLFLYKWASPFCRDSEWKMLRICQYDPAAFSSELWIVIHARFIHKHINILYCRTLEPNNTFHDDEMTPQKPWQCLGKEDTRRPSFTLPLRYWLKIPQIASRVLKLYLHLPVEIFEYKSSYMFQNSLFILLASVDKPVKHDLYIISVILNNLYSIQNRIFNIWGASDKLMLKTCSGRVGMT